jgi:alpha 1,6-mannosyltransferase
MIIPVAFSSTIGLVRRYPARVSFVAILILLWLCRPIYVPSARSLLSHPHPTTSSTTSSTASLEEIPLKIWQLYFGYSPLSDFAELLQSWITKNQDCAYTLVSDKGGDSFVREHYAHRPDVLHAFLDLRFPVLRSDFLRYLLLNAAGGVYSDLDTAALKPIRDWVSPDVRAKVHAIVGIEYDQRDDEPYVGLTYTRLQFCQWTMAASAGHPILQKIIERVVVALHDIAKRHNVSVGDLRPSDEEVMEITGPAIWTEAVMESLSEATGTSMSYINMTGMKESTLFGDILILPIDGFGIGQPHSGSTRGGGEDGAFVRHLFKGSWKHGWNN